VPDPDCRFDDATGRHRYTQPDWDELRRVVNGDGPCNAERLAVRRKAHDEGRWVREALEAHHDKQSRIFPTL
ncbi:MAG: 1,2-phenylacetyl-CoA epoxidase subunit A, partial [Bacteroidota bacterium]